MKKYKYILFYKPFNVLTQFTGQKNDKTLALFDLPKEVYPAGRLDKDSEGLLFLTDDGHFNQQVTNPNSHKEKTYWVQVEGLPPQEKLDELMSGLKIKDYVTKPCKAKIIDPQNITARIPPIRERKNIPTTWLEIKISEGKNRQVRRMTANIGYPTLRLIRVGIGKANIYNLKNELLPGQWIEVKKDEIL